MTQTDLAAAADVPPDVIRKLEQGQRNTASIASLHRIARARCRPRRSPREARHAGIGTPRQLHPRFEPVGDDDQRDPLDVVIEPGGGSGDVQRARHRPRREAPPRPRRMKDRAIPLENIMVRGRHRGVGAWRLLSTCANPAVQAGVPGDLPDVLRIEDGMLAEITTFGVSTFLGDRFGRAFELRVVTVATDCSLSYDEADWRDAVVVKCGEIEFACLGGTRRAFRPADVQCLHGLQGCQFVPCTTQRGSAPS